MKDVTGKDLTVGDKCVFIPQGGYTHELEMGIITAFTAQKVRLNPTNKIWLNTSSETCLKFPDQVAKV